MLSARLLADSAYSTKGMAPEHMLVATSLLRCQGADFSWRTQIESDDAIEGVTWNPLSSQRAAQLG